MGVAYHANYLVWCEVGRTDFIRELGVTYAELERRGHILAVAEASVRYGAPAHYDDQIQVATTLESVRSRAVTFLYEIERTDPDPAHLAKARTALISIDRDGRTRALPSSVLELFRS